ncbi:MAG: hypothetical protein Q9209_001184 [Squamulea sp. 1 TL-2023]
MGQTISTISRVWSNAEPKSESNPSDQRQCELQQAVNSACREVFEFEKLPLELQLMVIRFAMPLTGLRPGPWPHWIERRPYSFEELNGSIPSKEEIPVNLFRISKKISTLALSIFHNQVPLHIDICTWAIWYTAEKRFIWYDLFRFPSQLRMQETPQIRRMRNYQINFMLEDRWLASHLCTREYCAVFLHLKERLRLVCDALAHNDTILRLTVTIPCLCWPSMSESFSGTTSWIYSTMNTHSHGSFSQAYSKTLDFLSPLKRINVAEPVTFTAIKYHGRNQDRPDRTMHPCKHIACKNLAQSMQRTLGQLKRQELPLEEKSWKRVKEMDNGDPGILRSTSIQLLQDLWHRLNSMQSQRGMTVWSDDMLKQSFDDINTVVVISMQKDYRVWQNKQAKIHREESLRRLRNGSLAKLYSESFAKEYEALATRKNRTRDDEMWLGIHGKVFKFRKAEWARLTQEWHEQNPPIGDIEDLNNDGI